MTGSYRTFLHCPYPFLPFPREVIAEPSDEKTKRAVWSVSVGNCSDCGLTWWWW